MVGQGNPWPRPSARPLWPWLYSPHKKYFWGSHSEGDIREVRALGGILWIPGKEWALERTLWAPGPERALERSLWAPGTERALEWTLWAPGTESCVWCLSVSAALAAFCVYRKSLRSLSSAHEKWGKSKKKTESFSYTTC